MIAPTEWVHLQDMVKKLEMEPYKREQQEKEADT